MPEIAYQVDSFGHGAGLPAIYRGAGCRFAVHCRPNQDEMPTPSRLFRWRSPDGTEVLTANLDGYHLELGSIAPNWILAKYCVDPRVDRTPEQVPPA